MSGQSSNDRATIDVRMMRRGSRWCAVATIALPTLAAPIDLYADAAPGALSYVLGGRMGAAIASSRARKGARSSILRRARGLISGSTAPGGADDLSPAVVDHLQKTLLACEAGADLVSRARGGDPSARAKIASIFTRARGGDAEARRSARMLLCSAELVDDGRCSIRATIAPPARVLGWHGGRARRPLLRSIGHDIASVLFRRPAADALTDVEDDRAFRHAPLELPTGARG